MTSHEYDCTFKILVLGDSGVGKTCLIYRYTEGLFNETYVSTIGCSVVGIDCRTTMLEIEDLKVRMQIWDTAGQERFRTLTSAYYRGAMGVLLVYDVTAEESFNHVASWLRNIEDNASADVCKILVGNKGDLEGDRKVTKERGQMVAQNNNLQYFETSAKSGEGVDQIIEGNWIANLKQTYQNGNEVCATCYAMSDHLLGALATYKSIITIASCANFVSGLAFKSIAYLIKELKDRKSNIPDDINSGVQRELIMPHEQSKCC